MLHLQECACVTKKEVVYKECAKLGIAITAGQLLFYYYFSPVNNTA